MYGPGGFDLSHGAQGIGNHYIDAQIIARWLPAPHSVYEFLQPVRAIQHQCLGHLEHLTLAYDLFASEAAKTRARPNFDASEVRRKPLVPSSALLQDSGMALGIHYSFLGIAWRTDELLPQQSGNLPIKAIWNQITCKHNHTVRSV